MKTKFLVYGTLRSGNHAHRAFGLDHRATPLGEVFVAGTMYHLGGYPGVILGGDHSVVCELYETEDQALLAQLDGYEGYHPEYPEGSLYLRKEVKLADESSAYIYEYNRDVSNAHRLESGDWNTRTG